MMLGKRIQRILSGFMCLILILSLFISSTYAWDTSAGGDGDFGSVGSGNWLTEMQGIRITILAPDGKPAFAYGEYELPGVDILYSNEGVKSIDRMIGSCKVIEAVNGNDSGILDYGKPYGDLVLGSDPYMGEANLTSRTGIQRAIMSFRWLMDWIGTRKWAFVANSLEQEELVIDSLNRLSTTYPVTDYSGIWSVHGEEIAQLIYGDLNNTKPSENAAIHAIFNTINRQSESGMEPVWHLTDSGKRLFSDEIVDAYESGTILNGALYTATKLMEMGNMAIVVEPLVWTELKGNSGQRSGIWLYGTPTGIADKIKQLVDTEQWTATNWSYGGWDRSLFKASRMAFVLSKDIEYAGVTFTVPTDVQRAQTDENYYLSHDRISPKTIGWGLHMYVCGSPSTVPGIPTYNPGDPNPGEPHTPEDPGPGNIPLAPGENPTPETSDGTGYKQTTRAINIVKVYDIEKLDGTVEHVATKAQKYNPVQISIQHEPSYKVVDYYTSPVYAGDLNGWDSNPSLIDTTTWNDLINNTAITKTESKTFNWDTVKDKEAGDEEALVKLGVGCDCDPTTPENGKHYNDTTLYVHLLLKEEPIETHTFDDPDSPGSAPDPNSPDEGGPLTPQEQEQLKFNIVKVYETEDEYGTITTDSVTYRPNTAGIIEIEDEKDEPAKYELIEWLYSEEYKTGDSWDNIVGGIGIIGSGDKVDWCKESELRYSFPMASQLSTMVPMIPSSV